VTLILMISFGFAMVNYYDAPIPGFGRDFHHLITDEAASLSNQIGQANAQRIADDTGYVLGNLEAPGITQPIATFLYALLWLAAVATEGLALIVVAFGVVATAVCILLGPVFIPFLLFPNWTGSSGVGSRHSFNIRFTRSWPQASFTSSVSSPSALSTPRLRGSFHQPTSSNITRVGGHVLGRYLRDCQSPDAHESHLQRYVRRVGRQPL